MAQKNETNFKEAINVKHAYTGLSWRSSRADSFFFFSLFLHSYCEFIGKN